MKKHSREGVITHKFVEMMKLMNIYLNHFPKHEKQALCAQIRNTAYGLFNLITEGYKRYHKKTTLTQIDVMHEQLRMLINLAFKLGYYEYKTGKDKGHTPSEALRRYSSLSGLIDSLGEMIGGWIRSLRASAA